MQFNLRFRREICCKCFDLNVHFNIIFVVILIYFRFRCSSFDTHWWGFLWVWFIRGITDTLYWRLLLFCHNHLFIFRRCLFIVWFLRLFSFLILFLINNRILISIFGSVYRYRFWTVFPFLWDRFGFTFFIYPIIIFIFDHFDSVFFDP
jgi:hypothetical protein